MAQLEDDPARHQLVLPTNPVTVASHDLDNFIEGGSQRRRAVSTAARAPIRVTAHSGPEPRRERWLAIAGFGFALCHRDISTLQGFFPVSGR